MDTKPVEKDIAAVLSGLREILDTQVDVDPRTRCIFSQFDFNTEEGAWSALHCLGSDVRRSIDVIRRFHWIAWELLKGFLGHWKEHVVEINYLVEWTIEICRYPGFWTGGWDDELEFRADSNETIDSGEKMLSELWKHVGREGDLADQLEANYRQLSRSASWLFGQYAIRDAFGLYRVTFGTWRAALRLLFGLPILAGIIVGWLFMLQGDSVVKFALIVSSSLPRLLTAYCGFPAVSGWYVYEAAAQRGAKRPAMTAFWIVIASWFLSMFVGVAFVSLCGQDWFTEMAACDRPWWKELSVLPFECIAYRIVLVWAPVAVFVGIFAQVFWTGRAAVEPITS